MDRKLVVRIKSRRTITILSVALALITSAATTACKKDSSPTATFQAFYQSFKNKDVEAYKKTVSKKSLQVIEKRATDMGKPLNDSIQLEMNKSGNTLPDKLETRNEKIEGDRATLELKTR